MNDWLGDPEGQAWARRVLDDMFPKLQRSDMVVTLVPPGEGDAKLWVELGASIMLDKPILVVLLRDAALSPKLKLIADEVIRMETPDDPRGHTALQDAMHRIMEKLR